MFTIPLTLPSTKSIRIPELKNKHYFIILKYCTNDDYEGLYTYFKHLLFEEFKIPSNLDFIDIAYILIYMRLVFISPNIVITNSQRQEISIDLSMFLEKLETLETYGKRTITINNIICEIGLPTELYFTNIDDVIISSINNLTCEGERIDFQLLTKSQKQAILEQLPANLLTELIKTVKDISSKFGTVLFIEENKIFNIDGVELEIVSNQLFSFIKSLYNFDLRSFFELMFHYNNKIVHDSLMFMEMTPVDTQIILNFYKEEIKTQNEELKKSKH